MLPKVYTPSKVEKRWSEKWQEEKLFLPDKNSEKETYTIVIPPPNITGALHMGHALNNTLQDVLIRYKRMTGFASYWVPGTDHGGIATQNILEKQLKAEGETREDLGREDFLKRMWQWYEECGNIILRQLKKLGCALDISKENVRFTMDEKRKNAVFAAFKDLWDKGYIYPGERIINWCPRCKTALSDIEVEYEEQNSKLWHVHYPSENGGKGLIIATTRPETMLADTAVAVNPKDEKYRSLLGKKLSLPLTGRKIPVISDESVEIGFGTGALKVTPGHDPLDFEIGERHKLERLQVISFDGLMINCPEKYKGKKAIEARKMIVRDLEEAGYLVKEEPYKHSVSTCYRCHAHIEPLISEQWFVKMKSLAAPAINAAESGEIKFHPENWKKPFLQWLENIQDWCISRQIWWGHRIPAWYCLNCCKGYLSTLSFGDKDSENRTYEILPANIYPNNRKELFKHGLIIISKEKPSSCPKCGGKKFEQDPDVLDTWFSSALWPFSVFNWPEKTKDLERFYPTSTLVTGYEILYLWVARMVMSGYEHMGKKPFSHVYIHGTVRDKKGKKMSKSLGNVIDPLEMMAKYGTDAMRFSLITQAIGGKDIPFSQEMLIGGRNFVNKIYNVMRFILMHIDENEKIKAPIPPFFDISDRWIFHRYNEMIRNFRNCMESFDASNALNHVYSFIWDDFCDWYIELAKPRLETEERKNVFAIIFKIFSGALKTLHPFMPYISEELYQNIKKYLVSPRKFLLDEEIDKFFPELTDEAALEEMTKVMDITSKIRTLRSQFSIPPAQKIKALISSPDARLRQTISRNTFRIKHLSRLCSIEIGEMPKPPESVCAISGAAAIYLPIKGIIDIEREKTRLLKELKKSISQAEYAKNKLNDKYFREKAPKNEVEKMKQRKREAEEKTAKLKSFIAELE